MFTLTTSLHGSIGSPRHSSQTQRRNKRYPNWKGGGKIGTLHKWIHRVASVVSLCICDSHSPSCLFFQIRHVTGPVVEDLFLYLVEFGIFWQNVFPNPRLFSPLYQHFLFCFASYSQWEGGFTGSGLPMPCSAWSTPFLALNTYCFLSTISHDCKAWEKWKVISWS